MNFRVIVPYLVHSTFGLLSVLQSHSIMKGQKGGEHSAHKTKLLR